MFMLVMMIITSIARITTIIRMVRVIMRDDNDNILHLYSDNDCVALSIVMKLRPKTLALSPSCLLSV